MKHLRCANFLIGLLIALGATGCTLSSAESINISPEQQQSQQSVSGVCDIALSHLEKQSQAPSEKLKVLADIDKSWDKTTLPIPLKLTICNNDSEGVTLLKAEVVVTDSQGARLNPTEEVRIDPTTGRPRALKVMEGNLLGPVVEPGKQLSYIFPLENEYKFFPSREYELVIRQYIHLKSSEKELALLSAPIKLVMP